MFTWIWVFFTVFLKNKNIIFKIRRSKVTDYAALIRIVALNIKDYCFFFFFKSIIGNKHWTYQLLPINVLAWWFKLSKYSSMFYTETYLLYFFTFRWIRAMCFHQVEKNVIGPWISWNLIYIFLTYMDSLYVEMVFWQSLQCVKMLITNLTEYKIVSWKLGYHVIKMNAHPIS